MKNRQFVNNNTAILFLFVIGSFLFIELNFRYWYRFLEQYMMFQTTGGYFQDRLAEPGGLNEYVTEFLSLAFIHPCGASVVIALLVGLISGCFFLYLQACGVRASMLAAILPSFLIWIYPQESIALLVMLAFVQPRLMKRLVETYLVTGEYRAAEKYIKILESTPHYRDWAKAQRPLLDSVVCASTDWIKAKRAVLPVTDNPLDLTLTFPNALAFLIDDHADNRPAFEYGMGYLLVYKDLMTFMHYMELMKERGESFPVLYQEAICLFFAAVQKDPDAFKSYPISSEVQNRFLQFMKVARSMPPAALKAQFGDTYYYYAQFTPTPKRQ